MTKMWSILSAFFVVAAWWAHSFFHGAGVDFTALHWVVLLVWLIWVFFGAAVVWTFLGEREPRAAGVSAALFGAGALVIGAVLLVIFRLTSA